MNTEIQRQIREARMTAKALRQTAKNLDIYAADCIEGLIRTIERQDRKIERYESGEPAPVIREHIESLQRTIASQSEKINALRGTIDRLTARETPESRMKDGVCFRSVSGEQPEGRI